MLYKLSAAIKRRVIHKFQRLFYEISIVLLRSLSPQLVGKLVGKVTKTECLNFNPSNKSIFAIKANQNIKDLQELGRIEDLNIIYCDQYWISIIFKIYFNSHKKFLNHYYEEDHYPEKEAKFLMVSLKYFLREIEARYNKVGCILVPNYEQGSARIFQEYAKEEGIGFVSFHYEHSIVPMGAYASENCFKEYAQKSLGMKILLWHETAKNMLVNANYTTPERLVVSGAPRFNKWHEIHLKPSRDKKYITLLAFPGYDYFAPFSYIDIALIFRDFSLQYPEWDFVVKCKDERHVCETREILDGYCGNLHISSHLDMVDLLSQSKAIVGFNSLSFIEAFLSEAHLICPYWGDSRQDPYVLQINPLEPDAQKIMEVANSRAEFRSILEKIIKGTTFSGSLEERIKFFNKYVYFNPNHRTLDIFTQVFQEALNEKHT